eukprot:1136362-Pelagomonas_calceolata.AAC.6
MVRHGQSSACFVALWRKEQAAASRLWRRRCCNGAGASGADVGPALKHCGGKNRRDADGVKRKCCPGAQASLTRAPDKGCTRALKEVVGCFSCVCLGAAELQSWWNGVCLFPCAAVSAYPGVCSTA